MKKEWRNHLVTSKQIEEMENTSGLYVVAEEDTPKPKMYDLCHGVFDDIEIAKEYAGSIYNKEPIFVTDYNSYVEGNYNYLYQIGFEETEQG